jgi:membrane fusion protein (multidrug efflux system)
LIVVLITTACLRQRERPDEAIPVRTAVVKRASFTPSLTLLGTVHPQRSIPIVTLTAGTIRYASRFATGPETGAPVRSGELLGTIANDKLASSQEQERLRMEAADAELERAKRTFTQGVMSAAEYSAYRLRAQLAHESFAAAKRESANSQVVAAASGTLVVDKVVAAGSHVDAGVTLGQIAAGGAPIIEASVAASDRDSLHVGQTARFADGSHSGNARVVEVATTIDPSGTARVVLALTGGTAPPPGSGVSVDVDLGQRDDVLTVPEDAIVVLGDGPGVFVVGGAGEGYRHYRVKSVRVEIGRRAGGRIEVLSGIRDGDRVVIAGADALTDGAFVTDAEEKK